MTDIEVIAVKWKGTPFVPHAAQPGAGVDCVHLCAEILQEAGLIGDYAFPTYRCDSGSHRDESTVLHWLESQVGFLQVPSGTAIEPADILCFRVGRTAHHVGLALGRQRFIHAMRGKGVIISTLRDPTYLKRFETAYRPMPLSDRPGTVKQHGLKPAAGASPELSETAGAGSDLLPS